LKGVFAWVTVNYLLNKIGGEKKVPTVGIMDLGGASTQIVFEPNDPLLLQKADKYRAEMSFGKTKHVLYQHSYLGYGLMQARLKIKSLAADDTKKSPCVEDGRVEELAHDAQSPSNKITGLRKSYKDCENVVSKGVFTDTKACSLNPCSFDGVFMPPITKTFPHTAGYDMYAFSYFYDRTEPLGLVGTVRPADIKSKAEKICSSSLTPAEKKLVQDNPDFCLDLSYIYGLLTVGYNISDNRPLAVTKKINGFETGWCLGATIHMLDQMFESGDLKCNL
jgi:guanosine-diphosphatase